MDLKLEKSLVKKYPSMFSYYRKDPYSWLYYGVECYNGWYYLIDTTLEKIYTHIRDTYPKSYDQYKIHQIKTKFGGLRIYLECYDDVINELINNAEIISLKTCEMCGSTDESVSQNKDGWVYTKCNMCKDILPADRY
jgi:hypothetical protein